MKITIEPNVHTDTHPTVSVSVQNDDITAEKLFELMEQAMLAYGYCPEHVKELFEQ